MINPHDRIRGAADISMTPAGHAQVAELGQKFARNGPLDLVLSADLQRTRDTAHAVSNGAQVVETPHLRDLNYGRFTGMPTRDAISLINKNIIRTPHEPVDHAEGESFNSYKERLTGVAKLAIDTSNAYPEARIGLVVNRRSIKTLQGWLTNHRTDDKYDMAEALAPDKTLKPGSVFHLSGHKEGEYKISAADPDKPLEPGVYLIRHGLTAWNGESHEAGVKAPAPQQAIGTMQPPTTSSGPRIRGINDMIKNASTPS